jgi:phage terminase Nu1 subunit (DNA packaging protein)
MKKVNLSQYAQHRGVSKAAVSKAIKSGRITPHLDEKGNKFLYIEEADRQWGNRSDSTMGGKASDEYRKAMEPPKAPLILKEEPKKPAPEIKKVEEVSIEQFESELEMLTDEDEDLGNVNDIEDDDEKIQPLYKSKALKEAFLAKAVKLKYQRDRALLVPVDEVKEKWDKVVSLTRSKVLGIPSKFRQRASDVTNEMYVELENIVRDALEEISNAEH